MQSFVHRTPSSHVVFGPGCIYSLGAELGRLGLQRPLVLSGLRTAASGLHGAVRVALAGLQCCIPKLKKQKLPIIAAPGTASGAEVRPSLGVRAAAGHTRLFSDAQLAARLILIDPEANRCVPAALMLATGMSGRAHCLAGLYSKVRTPVSTALALHGTAPFFRALPAVADALADALVDALRSLRTRLGVPTRLRELGLTRQQLRPVAAQVMHERGLYFNPRPVAHAGEVEQLLARAW